MNYVTLSNGVKIPQLGYGVYQVSKDECERCVLDALSVGYRHIDTAQSYFNEEEVGNALVKSDIPRNEIFLTTKIWVEHYGYEQTQASLRESHDKLQTDYLDLVLQPSDRNERNDAPLCRNGSVPTAIRILEIVTVFLYRIDQLIYF